MPKPATVFMGSTRSLPCSPAKSLNEAGIDLETHEGLLNNEYESLIPSDESLMDRFKQRLKSNPSDFESLHSERYPDRKSIAEADSGHHPGLRGTRVRLSFSAEINSGNTYCTRPIAL